jgi:hypothetical protein
LSLNDRPAPGYVEPVEAEPGEIGISVLRTIPGDELARSHIVLHEKNEALSGYGA